jgi:hypothetical protein
MISPVCSKHNGEKLMPRIAKTYIALIVASGTTVLLLAAGSWSTGSLRQFAIYLGLAAVASTLKIRIPGIESTLSPNFVFLLLGMAFCRFSEIAVISLAAALVQSLWATKQARIVQVTFSAATLVLSASVAYQASHFLLGPSAVDSPVALVILAGSLYLPLNTALVSAVIGLVDGQPFTKIAQTCYECVFPYFMGGIVFAGLVSGAFSRYTVWKGALVLMPIVILGYMYSLSRTAAVAPGAVQLTLTEDEELVEVGS